MDNPGYEPLLDSKWAIPLVAMLIFVTMAGIVVIRTGLFLSRKLTARRSPTMVPARPALSETPLEGVAAN